MGGTYSLGKGRDTSMLKMIERILKPLKFTYFSVILLAITSMITFFLLVSSVQQETYEVKQFQIAPEAIRSLKTVEDTYKTEQERERAANEVSTVYQYVESIAKNRTAVATTIFDHFIEVKKEYETADIAIDQEAVAKMNEKLTALAEEEPELSFSEPTIKQLLALDSKTLESVKNVLLDLLDRELAKPIRSVDLNFSKYEVERQVRLSSAVPADVEETIITIARELVVETDLPNEELTIARQAEARNSVEPIRILQGQVIVREGQVIDGEVYRQLELAGLLTNQTAIKPIIGIGLFVLLTMSMVFMAFEQLREASMKKKKYLSIVISVYLLTVIMMNLIALIEPEFDILIAFLFPTALASMLLKLLINDRIAIMASVIIAATAGIVLQDGYASIIQMEIVLYILFGSLVSIYLLGNTTRRSSILKVSLGVTMSNLSFIAIYMLLTQSTYSMKEMIFYTAAAFVSGILSSSLTIGLLPFFETTFGILSDMKLIELSNPNHPLLKKILTEAPGTYHHSVMVANISDTACEAIGANGLLARVGAYYHDIGKTVRPQFFIENQHGKNPHDELPPESSKDIIIAHAEDGAELLTKHKMPSEIIDIARQHHGTSLLKFFLYKAKEMGQEVNELDYRYGGPKPQTREIAVISIADSVEAAVRSMKEPTTEKISQLVQSIIADKLKDGQFDECDLSMKEIKTVELAICETLNGIFHSRIEYPDEK